MITVTIFTFRFVYLEDCKHVLEATGLEQWMSQTDGEIKLKDCPKCKTPIAKTQRFMNMVKKVYQDVQRVKKRVFGNIKEIEASRDELRERLILMNRDVGRLTGNLMIHNYSTVSHEVVLPVLKLFKSKCTVVTVKLQRLLLGLCVLKDPVAGV